MLGISFYEFFRLGGIFMWPLALFSIIALAFILERSYVFFKVNLKPGPEIKKMFDKLKEKDVAGAREVLTCSEKSYINCVLRAGLEMISQDLNRMEKSIEAAINIKVRVLEKRLNGLVVLSNIAPLTGFLGTVSGMINAFKSIATADEVSTQLVAVGIYEALITTVAGLVIAIVVVSVHSIFMTKIEGFINDSERLSNELVETLIEKEIK